MAGPAVACHLADYEIPGNGFQVTCIRWRRLRAGYKTKDAGLTTFPFLREALASLITGPVP